MAVTMWAGAVATALAQDKPQGPAAIFKPLRVGQKVTLMDKGGAGVDVQLFNDGSIGTHSVIELGSGHLVVEDLVAISRIWIPTTSIRSVVWMRVREGMTPAAPKFP
jgi:hypothetical protein